MRSGALLITAVAVLVVGFLIDSATFRVHQTEQVLVLQFGQPIRVVTEPGLQFKIPFVQQVERLDNRILGLDAAAEEIIASDQKRLVVDSFVRYKIVAALQFYQAVGNERVVRQRLNAILVSSLRRVLGEVPLSVLLTGERSDLMLAIREQVNSEAQRLGIEEDPSSSFGMFRSDTIVGVRVIVSRSLKSVWFSVGALEKSKYPQPSVRQYAARSIRLIEPDNAGIAAPGQTFLLSAFEDVFVKSVARFGTSSFGEPSKPAHASVVEALKDMPEFEPLSALAGPPLLQLAESHKKNLVALLPDGLMSLAQWYRQSDQQDLDAFLKALAYHWTTVEDRDGFITVKPVFPATVRAERIDRAAVAKFVAAVENAPVITLDHLAILAKASQSDSGSLPRNKYRLHRKLASLAVPYEISQRGMYQDLALLVWHLLPKVAKDAAKSDWVVMPVGALDRQVQESIFNLLRNAPAAISKRPQYRFWPWLTMRTVVQAGDPSTKTATEQGLPTGSVVKFRFIEDTLLRPEQVAGANTWISADWTIEGIARSMVAVEDGRSKLSGLLDYRRLRPMPSQRFDLEIEIPGVGFASWFTQVHSLKYGQAGVPPEQLSAELKHRMIKAIEGEKAAVARGERRRIIPPTPTAKYNARQGRGQGA
ncbi:MAG: hypothetical protein IH945_08050 [Armatimonadetes bacterium]|nr:hypothetical protein [Armatimonadota bacterium]